jgi:hypothetical protein
LTKFTLYIGHLRVRETGRSGKLKIDVSKNLLIRDKNEVKTAKFVSLDKIVWLPKNELSVFGSLEYYCKHKKILDKKHGCFKCLEKYGYRSDIRTQLVNSRQ